MAPLNGNGFWQMATRGLLGILATIAFTWVSCQHGAIRDLEQEQAATNSRVSKVAEEASVQREIIQNREQYFQQLRELQTRTDKDSLRMEVRLVRLEMMMEQLLLVENIRPPKGLPKTPPIPKDDS